MMSLSYSDPYVRVSLRRDKKIFSKTTKTRKRVTNLTICESIYLRSYLSIYLFVYLSIYYSTD